MVILSLYKIGKKLFWNGNIFNKISCIIIIAYAIIISSNTISNNNVKVMLPKSDILENFTIILKI